MKNTVNIINFIRGPKCHPQCTDIIDAVKGHLGLLEEKKLPATFLLQYDAMIEPEIEASIKSTRADVEIGAWFEITEPLVVASGEPWRGFAFWDHRPCFSFMMGYEPQVRIKLIDTYMAKFNEIFGYYPDSVGAWMLDSISLKYLKEKYNVKAACICREQCGTDGYTLWGGYYSQGYYPSEFNMLSPAQTKLHQIKLPVFRMLGPDPIRQYDLGIYDTDGRVNPTDAQTVCTLEPSCKGNGGGNRDWVDWYFSELVSNKGIGFGYAQAGQENSFGWGNDVKGALEYQYTRLLELISEGKLTVEKLSETGCRFNDEFELSPTYSMDHEDETEFGNTKSIWYYSPYYRLNFLKSGDKCRIRDIHIFDEMQKEIYFDDVTRDSHSYYKTLPIIDGYNFSRKDYLSSGYILNADKTELNCVKDCDSQKSGLTHTVAIATAENSFKLVLNPETVEMTATNGDFMLCLKGLFGAAECSVEKNTLCISNGRDNYSLSLTCGLFTYEDGEIYVNSEQGRIAISFKK